MHHFAIAIHGKVAAKSVRMANKAGKARCALNGCVDKNGKKREVWVFKDGGREFCSIFCKHRECASLLLKVTVCFDD